mmetsp:Transcript_90003/g.176207  ORF Transcript_90003/g.176207 Transcript_90003/m.176207 type:complete len:108 (+) Transcript_90003:111-434(+)
MAGTTTMCNGKMVASQACRLWCQVVQRQVDEHSLIPSDGYYTYLILQDKEEHSIRIMFHNINGLLTLKSQSTDGIDTFVHKQTTLQGEIQQGITKYCLDTNSQISCP